MRRFKIFLLLAFSSVAGYAQQSTVVTPEAELMAQERMLDRVPVLKWVYYDASSIFNFEDPFVEEQFEDLSDALNAYSRAKIYVVGYASGRGSEQLKNEMAQKRINYIIEQLDYNGVSKKRIAQTIKAVSPQNSAEEKMRCVEVYIDVY